MPNKTTEEFIEQARTIHGETYDYSLVEYINSRTKIDIVCYIHGTFQRTPNEHLKGIGCHECAMEKNRLNREASFIEKANKIHDGRYDYSLVNYFNRDTKIDIICPEHGVFTITPDAHLNGYGCCQCANETRRKNKEESFIQEALNIHGTKFDYSKVHYTGVDNNVTIICKEHGEFEQTPWTHLHSKKCCPKCSGLKKKTTEEFIEDARLVHGDKYDYSQAHYINAQTPVTIVCKEHGFFEKTPAAHIHQKQGCPKCSLKIYGSNRRKTTEEFIEQARTIHGNKYDYSLVDYITSHSHVLIICPEHGSFNQIAGNHLRGMGCPTCDVMSKRDTLESFIEKAKKVHGERYDYSQVKYINSKTAVDIICPKHGVFSMPPNRHLRGSNCPRCNCKHRLTNEEFMQRASEAHNNKYDYSLVKYINTDTPVQIVCPIHGLFEQAPHQHLMGVGCPGCTVDKINETKRTNSSFHTSKPEDDLYELLCDAFGKDDVKRQYNEERYPFNCDFYILSRDLFIELNASWTHGHHFFDENNDEDCAKLEDWRNRNSSYYAAAIDTWTRRDPLKRKTAEENNLNYLVFWDNDLTDAKEWLANA